jgi:adenylate cyclase
MSHDLDIRRADAQVQQALALDPNNSYALAWAGSLATSRGEFGKAIDLVQRSIVSDPVNPIRYLDLANTFYFEGKYAESLAAVRKADDLSPGADENTGFAGLIFLLTGNAAGAFAKIGSGSDLASRGYRVIALDALGRKPEADAALAELERNDGNSRAYDIALIYAKRRDADQAFKWLDRAYRQHETHITWVKVEPFLKNIQQDPGFTPLLIKLGLQ